MKYKDYYGVMGVDRKASAEEIKNAYRKLARSIIRTFPRNGMPRRSSKSSAKPMKL